MIKYIASCSCGKDSLAMVLKLIEKGYPLDCVVFVDLGKEFKSIYNVWDKLCKELDKHKIEHVKLTLQPSFDFYFGEKNVNKKNGTKQKGYYWCGGRARWGTTFKKQMLNNFYKQKFSNDLICEYVGIAKDELERVKIDRTNTIKIYPLIYWGMNENDCLVYCYKRGYNWKESNGVDLYNVLDRVSCFCCGNKNQKECKQMIKYLPDYWNEIKRMESVINKPFKGIGTEKLEDKTK